MPWCPKCRLEYVAGIKVCPDCKEALVDELSEETEVTVDKDYYNNQESFDETLQAESGIDKNEVMKEIFATLKAKGMSDEEITAMLESIQNQKNSASKTYKPVSDKLEEHKSGSVVLTICGIVGILVLVLNALKVISLPVSGFQFYLVNVVMGFLFLVFLFSGIKSFVTVKKLRPMVAKEQLDIEEILKFVKGKKAEGVFDVKSDDFSMEELSLVYTNIAVREIEKNYSELPVGFAYYVVDKFYSEIFEEETDED